MAAGALEHDTLRPRPLGGLGRGAVLALLAHGVLVAMLALGVRWRTAEPEGVTAELWAAVPQVAAPPAAEAPPAPPPVVEKAPPKPAVVEAPPQRDAQIAIERAEREKKRQEEEREKAEKAEKLKAERERQKQEQERADKQTERERQLAEKMRADEQRLAKLREDNLKRMLGQVGGTGAPGATGNAARDAGPSASYAGRVIARIRPNIVLTIDVAGDPRVEVEVRTAPDGTIVGRRIVKASGVKDWDDAVLRAIDKTEVLPRDVDGRVPSVLTIGFRPKD